MDYKWTPEEKKVVDGLQFELEYAKRNNLASARVPRGMLEKMDSVNFCPFDKTTPVVCNGSHYCKECIENNIEWEVTDGG